MFGENIEIDNLVLFGIICLLILLIVVRRMRSQKIALPKIISNPLINENIIDNESNGSDDSESTGTESKDSDDSESTETASNEVVRKDDVIPHYMKTVQGVSTIEQMGYPMVETFYSVGKMESSGEIKCINE